MYAIAMDSAQRAHATSTSSLVDDVKSVLSVQWQCLLREVDLLLLSYNAEATEATEATFTQIARKTNSLCWTGELLANLCFDLNEFDAAACYVEASLQRFGKVQVVSGTLEAKSEFQYLRRQSSIEINRVIGHDGLLQIGESKTVWRHLLGSHARIRFCQAEQARRRNRDFKTVMALFEEAISAFQKLPQTDRQKRGICRCHQGICDLRRRVLNPQDQDAVSDLLASYDQVIGLARQTGDQCLEATQLKNQGIVLKDAAHGMKPQSGEQMQWLDKAAHKYQAAIEIHSRLGEHKERCKELRGLAGIFLLQRRFDEAAAAALESRQIGQACNYKDGIDRALNFQTQVFSGRLEAQLTAGAEVSVAECETGLGLACEVLQAAYKLNSPGTLARAQLALGKLHLLIVTSKETSRPNAAAIPVNSPVAAVTWNSALQMLRDAHANFSAGAELSGCQQVLSLATRYKLPWELSGSGLDANPLLREE
jgi:hypothetical protein